MSQHFSELAGHVAPNENFVRVALVAMASAFPDPWAFAREMPTIAAKDASIVATESRISRAEPIAIELLNAPGNSAKGSVV
jgi:hypothetical protein